MNKFHFISIWFKIKSVFLKLVSNELFWLLVICLTIRNLFFQFQDNYVYNTDSVTYYYAAHQIFKGLIDPGRPPVYPILIKFFELFNRDEPFKYLVYFQHTLSFVSIIPFYWLNKGIITSRVIIIIMTIIYGTFPILLYYNNAILAESILISLLIIFTYLIFLYSKSPSKIKIIFINLFLFFLVMIKPVCIVLYGVIIFYWLIRIIIKNDIKYKKSILYSYLLSLVLLFGYCGVNKMQNNFFSVSSVGHDNKFINVIFSDAYRTIPDKDFVKTIDSTLHKGHYYTIYYLNNDYSKYQNGFKMFPLEYKTRKDMIDVYNTPSNPLGYNANNISKYINRSGNTAIHWSYIFKKSLKFLKLKLFFINGAIIYIILLLDFLVLISTIKKRKLIEFKVFVFLTEIALLCGFFVAGVSDGTYSRVLLPLFPFLIISFFGILDHLLNVYKNKIILFNAI